MRDIDEIFTALGKSKFRSSIKLRKKERQYLEDKGFETILEHAHQFIKERLADAHPKNDGKQTPMKNHPVFIAQHATGTCCRSCLEKWHHISKGTILTDEQIDYIVNVINYWLIRADSESLGIRNVQKE